MQVKRFFAADMRQAMKLVRDELGAEAAIIGNRRIAGGVELTAALDYKLSALAPIPTAPPLLPSACTTMRIRTAPAVTARSAFLPSRVTLSMARRAPAPPVATASPGCFRTLSTGAI